VNITPYLGAIDSLLELGAMTPYFAAIMLELIGTPYFGATMVSLLETRASELVTFGVSLDAGAASEELEAGASSAELAASALDSGVVDAELASTPSVAELDLGSGLSIGGVLLPSSAEEVVSQLAQKKAVSESRTFFQCL
jgi:hypothetical protein